MRANETEQLELPAPVMATLPLGFQIIQTMPTMSREVHEQSKSHSARYQSYTLLNMMSLKLISKIYDGRREE